MQTAYNLPNGRKHHVQGVNELDAGLCDGMSYEKIKEEKPWVYDGRKNDKFAYNYPEGESYVSILRRAYPMIRRLEGVGMREHFVGADPHSETGPVLLVAHNAVIRVIYGYMTGATSEHIPRIPIPLHTLIQLTPLPFAGPDSVSPGAQVSSGSGAPASCGYVETRISMEGAEHLAEAPSA
jgi:broad specificity phosphatase PhoE